MAISESFGPRNILAMSVHVHMHTTHNIDKPPMHNSPLDPDVQVVTESGKEHKLTGQCWEVVVEKEDSRQ